MRTLALAGRMSTGGLARTDVGTREVIGGKTARPRRLLGESRRLFIAADGAADMIGGHAAGVAAWLAVRDWE